MVNQQQIIRRRITFYGRVQGVGFRYVASYAAGEAGATGWVKNEYDGSVSMEIQGTDVQIRQVIALLDSARYIRIERMETRDIPVDAKEKKFRVRY